MQEVGRDFLLTAFPQIQREDDAYAFLFSYLRTPVGQMWTRKFLRHHLLPHGIDRRAKLLLSPFHMFTYTGNGRAGNVDAHHDIIDVILSYVTGL